MKLEFDDYSLNIIKDENLVLNKNQKRRISRELENEAFYRFKDQESFIQNIVIIYENKTDDNITDIIKEDILFFKKIINGGDSFGLILKNQNNYIIEKYIPEKVERKLDYQHKTDLLKDLRENALGLGTRKIKLRLNKIIKEKQEYYLEAKILRLALEIEDYNIRAKNTNYRYINKVYYNKDKFLKELFDYLKEIQYNKAYGWEKDENLPDSIVFYLDLPFTKTQISWHTFNNAGLFKKKEFNKKYGKKWDGIKNPTTYEKIINDISYIKSIKSA